MLFNDNLVWNKELNIPANTQNFFIFKKHWDYSQLIIFDINNVYVSNLYCIIQSYLNNKDLYSTAIFTCQVNKYNETKILSYHNIFIVKKMNYFFFKEWWENLSEYDKKYITEWDMYGIVIKFSQTSFTNLIKNHPNDNPYESIKPKFPWKSSIKRIINVLK